MSEWKLYAVIWTLFFYVMGFSAIQLPEPYNMQCLTVFLGLYLLIGFLGRELYFKGDGI